MQRNPPSLVLSICLSAALLVGCRTKTNGGPDASASVDLGIAAPPPVPPKGMIWIPPGILIAGTPEGRTPRVPDAEMPGAQVVMKGFFVDELPYPNEAGSIPRTGVTQPEASRLCEAQGKRLCAELEWERACKGPHNTTYEYGDVYRASECGTGTLSPAVPPTGILAGCRSAFGVRDMHGGVFEWTSSPWGRGTTANLVTLRGGNAEAGAVVGRCANGIGRRPTEARPDFGFRCCAGERNLAEVTLDIVHGEPLRPISNDPQLISGLEANPPDELKRLLSAAGLPPDAPPGRTPYKVLVTWRWHPVGNEELVLQSLCAQIPPHALCGMAVGRPKRGILEPLAFASTSWWTPTLHEDQDPRDLWVMGGDELGAYRRKLQYAWGQIIVGDAEHKAKPGEKKKKR